MANATAFPVKRVRTSALDLAYEEHGHGDGDVAVLLHGFPYDPRCYDDVAPALAGAGMRVIVPYLRGYGPTRFLSDETPRSGQQAALGKDLLDLLDALSIKQAMLAGYDWGGRAACIVAALWPERAKGLVTGNGYNIQNIPGSTAPDAPDAEYRYWYQYYFHTPRGEAGLAANRFELNRLLWRLWSPTWKFDEDTYRRSAVAFDNPDFVDVVVHSYRHRYGYVAGDPAVEEIERQLTRQPKIGVRTISIWGNDDGVVPPLPPADDARHFSGSFDMRRLPGVGHNIPQEAPREFAAAVLELAGR